MHYPHPIHHKIYSLNAGNHEAWRKGTAAGGSALLVNDPNYKRPDNRMASDSVAKLVEVVECARKCGVYVGPLRVVLAGASADAAADSGTASDVSTAQNSVESVADEVSAVLSVAADVSSNPRPEPVTLNSLRLDDISTSLGANCSDTVTAIATDAATTEKETAVVIMPLYGWYHSSWDTEPEITDPQFVAVERAIPFSRKWGDYAMCTWPRNIISHEEFVKNPLSSTTLAETFAKLNEPFLHPPPYKKVSNDGEDEITEEGGGGAQMRRYFGTPLAKSTDTIISYSHYLPRLELCPEKRFLSEPMLSKVIGRYAEIMLLYGAHFLSCTQIYTAVRFCA